MDKPKRVSRKRFVNHEHAWTVTSGDKLVTLIPVWWADFSRAENRARIAKFLRDGKARLRLRAVDA